MTQRTMILFSAALSIWLPNFAAAESPTHEDVLAKHDMGSAFVDVAQLVEQGDYSRAAERFQFSEQDFAKRTASDPKSYSKQERDAIHSTTLGLLHLEHGDWNRARIQFKRVLASTPNNPIALAGLKAAGAR